MEVGEAENYGKLGALVFTAFSAVSAFVWKAHRHGEQIKDLENAVFPSDPGRKPITLEWHDRIQAECERQRARDMEIMAAHIVAQLRDKLDELKDEVWERRRDTRQ
jgi:hypothetical protein